jgi:creatinine amidohydrolase
MSTHPLDMSELTWPEYRDLIAQGAPIAVPLGSVEQHGPHLPLGTDWMLITELCRRVAREIGGIVAPPLLYGYKSHMRTGGGDGFPGTINLSAATYTATVREVLSELVRHRATRLLVINGHSENEWFAREACDLAAADAAAGGREVRIVLMNFWAGADGRYIAGLYPGPGRWRPKVEHAAWVETSMLLHLLPEQVRQDAYPPDEVAEFPDYDVFPERSGWIPASGSQSPVGGSSREAGQAIADHYVDNLVAAARVELDLPAETSTRTERNR